jgi:hypothetical protein
MRNPFMSFAFGATKKIYNRKRNVSESNNNNNNNNNKTSSTICDEIQYKIKEKAK